MISSSLKILQVNLNKSAPATESALQIAIEQQADLIFVQEPWLTPRGLATDFTNTRSIAHSGYTQILPKDLTHRPRTLIYAARALAPQLSLDLDIEQDSDFQALNITEGTAKIQILHIYNESDQSEHSGRHSGRHSPGHSLGQSNYTL